MSWVALSERCLKRQMSLKTVLTAKWLQKTSFGAAKGRVPFKALKNNFYCIDVELSSVYHIARKWRMVWWYLYPFTCTFLFHNGNRTAEKFRHIFFQKFYKTYVICHPLILNSLILPSWYLPFIQDFIQYSPAIFCSVYLV